MIFTTRKMSDVRWAFNIATWQPTAKEWANACSCILPEEKKRIHQFVFKDDAMLALTGRLLLRSCIQQLLGISNTEIKLGRTQKFKPILIDRESNVSFNVSHQGNYSIIAGSLNFNVGVDIMKIDRPVNTTIPEFFKTMRRQFTPEEWMVIKSKPNEWEQMKTFYRLWCLKESYVKAIGTGLGTSTADYMRFELHSESLTEEKAVVNSMLYIDGTAVDWTFHESLLDNEHIATVALKSNDRTGEPPQYVPFETISFEDMIKNLTQIGKVDPDDWIQFSSKKKKPQKTFNIVQ